MDTQKRLSEIDAILNVATGSWKEIAEEAYDRGHENGVTYASLLQTEESNGVHNLRQAIIKVLLDWFGDKIPGAAMQEIADRICTLTTPQAEDDLPKCNRHPRYPKRYCPMCSNIK